MYACLRIESQVNIIKKKTYGKVFEKKNLKKLGLHVLLTYNIKKIRIMI